MAFSFTPQQPQQSLFQSPFQQSNPFQSQQQQQQQSPFQLQLQQPQQQQQQQAQSQAQLYLFTNDKAPASYSTKWDDLHPDSKKVLLEIEQKILEYRDESERLEQCSRLYDSSVSNNGFELESSYLVQELGGISIAMERQKPAIQELTAGAKDMLRNTEMAVRSYMMLQPRFLHKNKAAITAPSQPSGATATAQTSSSQTAANTVMPILDFYSGVPKKPSPFLLQTVARYEKYLSECRQMIEELEQLLLLQSEKASFNSSSSLLQSLPKIMANVHDFFVHVAAKVESIHQYIESMKTAFLTDRRRQGDTSDPFIEADRREAAKQEAAAKRVHPTLHLPAVPQPTAQAAGGAGPFAGSAAPAAASAPTLLTNVSASSGSGSSLFSTPFAAASTPSLFSTPTTSAPVPSLFGSAATAQSSPFSSLTPSTSAFGASTPLFGSTPAAGASTPLFGSTPAAAASSPLFGSTPAAGASTPLFGSTPAAGASTFSTPFATGAATGSGASFGTLSKARAKSRTGRR